MELDLDPTVIAILAGSIVLLLVVVATTVVLVARRRRAATLGPGGMAMPYATGVPVVWSSGAAVGAMPMAAPQGMPVSPAQAWQQAGPLLQQMGFTQLDAECFYRDQFFVKLHLNDGEVRGWVEKPCPGGILEMFIGKEGDLSPGSQPRTDVGKALAAGGVGEVLGQLPHKARVRVKAPEIPGDDYSTNVTSPLSAGAHAAAVARVLFAIDAAATQRAPAGMQAQLPPIVVAWQQAGPQLQQLGFSQLDAECFTRGQCFVKLHVRDGSLRGWLESPYPGGMLEAFIGARAEVNPGDQGRSDLARFVAGSVAELLGQLPRQARLTAKAPELPGDEGSFNLDTPFSHPAQAAMVARVLLALDEAARRSLPAGMQPQLPPIALAWQQASASLEALGMTRVDAECYYRGPLFVKVHVRDGSLRAWLERPCPGSVLERFLRAQAELGPGDQGNNELARFVASQVREMLGWLPRGTRLTVKAPEIPGAEYSVNLDTPFTDPRQAEVVARIILALDQAVATRG